MNTPTTIETFDQLPLKPELLKAISDLSFSKPSPIQAQALPLLLEKPTDFLGLAATGTGKTAAFVIPLLQKLDPSLRAPQGLILCPTRELALQVAGQIDLLGKYLKVRSLPIYGGASYSNQIHGLKNGAQIIVGTPGRIVDHIDRGTLKLGQIKTLILDEADEMISMGFKEDMEKILQQIKSESSNTWLFSATMSPEVRKVSHTYLRSPQQVQINKQEVIPSTVEQFFYLTRESNKPEILCKLIDAAEDFYGLVFCQTKSMVTDLTSYLNQCGYKVDCLHGDKSQNERERTLQAFRQRQVKILICTDVASRGIDVKDITHVINYSLPRELENYVHRIGRTARSGKSGVAMSLVSPAHQKLIPRIEKITKSKMKEGRVPSRKEVAMKKVSAMLFKLQSQTETKKALELIDEDWKAILSMISPEELAAKFLVLTLPRLFSEEDERPQQPKTFEQKREEINRKEGRHRSDRRPQRQSHKQHRHEDKYFGFQERRRDKSYSKSHSRSTVN